MYRSLNPALGFGFKAIKMSCDHTLDNKDEIERVIRCGGKVSAKSAVDKNDARKTIIQGPLRIWYRCSNLNGSMMGLAMTRSLGDTEAHKVGVSHKPYQRRISIKKDDEFIIVASDGLWDVISTEEAARVLNEYIASLPPVQTKVSWEPKEATKLLVARARKKWSGASNIDDITCCIIKLKNSEGAPCFIDE